MAEKPSTTDLRADVNQQARLFSSITQQSKTVTIASIALIVSILSLLMAWMAVYDAVQAKTQVAALLESNAVITKEARLLQYKFDLVKAKLEATQGEE